MIERLCIPPASFNNYKNRYLASEDGYNSQEWLDDNTQKVDAALMKACEKGSPQALQTFYKLNQRLIDRKEESVKVEFTIRDRQELTAGIINGLREEARVTGVCSVCGKSEILCNELLLPAKSKYSESGTMEAVEVSA